MEYLGEGWSQDWSSFPGLESGLEYLGEGLKSGLEYLGEGLEYLGEGLELGLEYLGERG